MRLKHYCECASMDDEGLIHGSIKGYDDWCVKGEIFGFQEEWVCEEWV